MTRPPLDDTATIRVLGPIEVHVDGRQVELGQRLRRLVAALAIAGGDVVSDDRLCDIVWSGTPPEHAVRTLRTYVTRLRQALDIGPGAIEYRAPGYALMFADGIDSRHFENELDDALTCLRAADHETAADLLFTAIGRWSGRAYGEHADEEWARPEAVRLEQRLIQAREAQIEVLLATGAKERAVAEANALVEAEPLRERPRALLMTAQYASGQQAAALRQFRAYANLLAEETGLEPSPDIAALEGRIVRGELPRTTPAGTLKGYELGERIGAGAFAVVYAGVQPGLERDVAVKIIRGELADRPEFIRRFEFEARTVARLEHPHIVPLYDYWREPGAGFLVMRLMPGGSVERALRARGPYSTAQAARLVVDLEGALTTAHRAGVVHRDIRPANLLLDNDGATYLADFGIALPLASPEHTPVAEPAYAAPELLRGEPPDATSDVLSLGVTLFEVLTGRLPFANSTDRAELVRRQMTEPLPPVRATRPELPSTLDDVLARATAKARTDRYPSVAAFAGDVIGILDQAGGQPSRRSTLASAARGPVVNPYVGLHAFDEADADRFVGRETLVAEIVDAIEQHRLVTVVGPSGSGKSSAVRAGVVPAIRRGAVPGSDSWFITTMLPGNDPIEALEVALLRIAVNPPSTLRTQLAEPGGLLRAIKRVLPDDRSRIFLVIDQFEELFTNTQDPGERTRFLDELAAALSADDSPLRVVSTIRADHYDAPLRNPAFAELVSAAAVSVTPMNPDQLERSISTPASRAGVDVEPALVAQLVAQITANPSSLPLLQFALTEVFDRRVAEVMLLSTHQELGGLSGSLSVRADRIIAAGGPTDEREARRVFARLVTLGEGVEDTRRRALRSELGNHERASWLIDAFVKARLLSTDVDEASREPTVEVAHEALLRAWPRLRGWLDEDRADVAVLHAVSRAATEWNRVGRDPGELARGGRLETVADLAARRSEWLAATESAWIEASVDAAEAAEQERIAIAERDRRQNRRLRRSLVVASCLLVVSVLAAIAALVLRNRSIATEQQADIERLVALSAAELESEPSRSILLALEAYQRSPDPATAGAVQRAIASEPRFVAHTTPLLGDGANAEISRDGSTVVESRSVEGGTELLFVNLESGRPRGESVQISGQPDVLAVSGDGSVAAALAVSLGQVRVVRASGSQLLTPGADLLGNVVLDETGSTMVVDSPDEIFTVDTATGSVVAEHPLESDPLIDRRLLGVSPDGVSYAYSSADNIGGREAQTVIVESATGDVLASHPSRHNVPWRIAWAPTGGYAIGYVDGAIELFDGANVLVGEIPSGGEEIRELAYGDDGNVTAAAADATVRTWSPSLEPVGQVVELGDPATSIARLAGGRVHARFTDGTGTTVAPDASAISDLTRPAPFGNLISPVSPYYGQPGIVETASGPAAMLNILRRLDDDELVAETEMAPELPDGMNQAPFISTDGEWRLFFGKSTAFAADLAGEHRYQVDFAHMEELAGIERTQVVRLAAGGEALIVGGPTSDGGSRIASFSLPDHELVAGPRGLIGGVGPFLMLADGDIAISGSRGVDLVEAQGTRPVQIADAALTEEPLFVDGSEGLIALHEGADGSVLLGGGDGSVAVLDTANLTLDFLDDQPGAVFAGAFSPKGDMIAVLMPQIGVQLLDTATGASIGVPMLDVPLDGRSPPGVRWSEDGKHVWIPSAVGPQRFLASPELWVEQACAIAGRELTATEWHTYVNADSEPVSACDAVQPT